MNSFLVDSRIRVGTGVEFGFKVIEPGIVEPDIAKFGIVESSITESDIVEPSIAESNKIRLSTLTSLKRWSGLLKVVKSS